MGSSDPSTEDGLIEVLGLTTYQLVSTKYNKLVISNHHAEDFQAVWL